MVTGEACMQASSPNGMTSEEYRNSSGRRRYSAGGSRPLRLRHRRRRRRRFAPYPRGERLRRPGSGARPACCGPGWRFPDRRAHQRAAGADQHDLVVRLHEQRADHLAVALADLQGDDADHRDRGSGSPRPACVSRNVLQAVSAMPCRRRSSARSLPRSPAGGCRAAR